MFTKFDFYRTPNQLTGFGCCMSYDMRLRVCDFLRCTALATQLICEVCIDRTCLRFLTSTALECAQLTEVMAVSPRSTMVITCLRGKVTTMLAKHFFCGTTRMKPNETGTCCYNLCSFFLQRHKKRQFCKIFRDYAITVNIPAQLRCMSPTISTKCPANLLLLIPPSSNTIPLLAPHMPLLPSIPPYPQHERRLQPQLLEH